MCVCVCAIFLNGYTQRKMQPLPFLNQVMPLPFLNLPLERRRRKNAYPIVNSDVSTQLRVGILTKLQEPIPMHLVPQYMTFQNDVGGSFWDDISLNTDCVRDTSLLSRRTVLNKLDANITVDCNDRDDNLSVSRFAALGNAHFVYVIDSYDDIIATAYLGALQPSAWRAHLALNWEFFVQYIRESGEKNTPDELNTLLQVLASPEWNLLFRMHTCSPDSLLPETRGVQEGVFKLLVNGVQVVVDYFYVATTATDHVFEDWGAYSFKTEAVARAALRQLCYITYSNVASPQQLFPEGYKPLEARILLPRKRSRLLSGSSGDSETPGPDTESRDAEMMDMMMRGATAPD